MSNDALNNEPEKTTFSQRFVLNNNRGLHARSAARIIQLIQVYDCKIHFIKGERRVEGDSIISLLTLNCPRGTVLEVEAEGPQAEECLRQLGVLFDRNFGEV